MKEFSSNFFAGNRKKLRDQCKNDAPIVITANGLVQRAGDTSYPFRQDSNFWYLTGVELPDVVLVVTVSSEYLILPERDAILDYFDGAIDTEELKKVSGIKTIFAHHEGWEKLGVLMKKYKLVNACLHKGYDQRNLLYLNPSKPRLISRLKKLSSNLQLNDIRLNITHMRMVKQAEELYAIQQAVDITVESLTAIFKDDWYKKFKNERLIDARITFEYSKRGADLAYPSIVAGGKRACTLHYIENNHKLASDELLLIDAGAEYNNYAADITRMYAPESITGAKKSVYLAVKEAQEFTFSLLKPGADIREVNNKVIRHIGKYLKTEKLTPNLNPANIRKYFPHAVSHHLGLDVHDAADYSLPLAEGMVITVEPGIYIVEKEIGVRIEDDVLITKNGCKVLSAALPS